MKKFAAVLAALLALSGCVSENRTAGGGMTESGSVMPGNKSWQAINSVCVPYYGEGKSDRNWFTSRAESVTGNKEMTEVQKKTALLKVRGNARRWEYMDGHNYFFIELTEGAPLGCRVVSVLPNVNLLDTVLSDRRYRQFGECEITKSKYRISVNLFRHTRQKDLVLMATSERGLNFFSVGMVPTWIKDEDLLDACKEFNA